MLATPQIIKTNVQERFQPDADAATLIDIGTFGGNAPGDILDGQYSWHRSPP